MAKVGPKPRKKRGGRWLFINFVTKKIKSEKIFNSLNLFSNIFQTEIISNKLSKIEYQVLSVTILFEDYQN